MVQSSGIVAVVIFLYFALTTMSVIDPTKAVNFFNVIGRLKTLKRTGWVNNSKSDDHHIFVYDVF
jgi:hypothetical protein